MRICNSSSSRRVYRTQASPFRLVRQHTQKRVQVFSFGCCTWRHATSELIIPIQTAVAEC